MPKTDIPIHVPDDLALEMVPVDELLPYADNPRVPGDAVDVVARLIQTNGFRTPIEVNSEGVIVAGHTRLLAAQQLGMEVVPVIRSSFTDAQFKGHNVGENKSHDFGEWDLDKLASEVRELTDMGVDPLDLGFNDDELLVLFADGAAGEVVVPGVDGGGDDTGLDLVELRFGDIRATVGRGIYERFHAALVREREQHGVVEAALEAMLQQMSGEGEG